MADAGPRFVTPIDLDRDTFMRRLIASLGSLNEAILGSDVAGAYIMNVGLSMGAAIEAEYKHFLGIDRPFNLDEYAHVIVDLKQKIGGNFSLVSKDPTKVVVQATSCPFDEFVRQSPSLCFMTSSVFGGIAARNFGYAKVVLHQRIALGDPRCYDTVFLQRTPESVAAIGREYFPDVDKASPDIAEQIRLMDSVRRIRKQLIETNARWEELVSNAADAIVMVDRESRILYANACWRDLLGVEGGELIGSVFDRIVHTEDQWIAQEALALALRGTRVTGRECRLRHRDGSWRTVLASASPVRDEQGEIVGALGILRDVTEERDAQRLKSEFLATASHELRTPVTTIKGLTQLLMRTIEKRGTVDPAQLSKRLALIQREADRLAFLSAELVDIARLNAGKLRMQTAVHDLNQIVDACVARHRELLEGLGTHHIAFRRASKPIPVAVERERIELVLSNLLDNAVKYSPFHDEIVVTTAIDEQSARVSVTDRGIGIPPRDLPKLFTPFFRATNAPSRNYGGLGLGLHLSQAIVEAHGGSLQVSSVEGEGTTITLSLPLARAEE